jgi:hypothetical protein
MSTPRSKQPHTGQPSRLEPDRWILIRQIRSTPSA